MPKALTFWNCFQYHLPLYDIGQDSIGPDFFKTFREKMQQADLLQKEPYLVQKMTLAFRRAG